MLFLTHVSGKLLLDLVTGLRSIEFHVFKDRLRALSAPTACLCKLKVIFCSGFSEHLVPRESKYTSSSEGDGTGMPHGLPVIASVFKPTDYKN